MFEHYPAIFLLQRCKTGPRRTAVAVHKMTVPIMTTDSARAEGGLRR
jgi:hypothetical protein